MKWLREVFEPSTREKAAGKPHLLICDGHDSHITASWITHCMKNNIIFMVLPPHSSHLTQPLDVGVFGPLKTLMISEMESLVSIEVHRILKAEWFIVYIKAHKKVFLIQNVLVDFYDTGIRLFNPSKVINRIMPIGQDSNEIRSLTPVKVNMP